ncbi:MAG TPA: ABC transporter ATP-binding protein [Anaerolineaceae bacterium]|nr:ABC transporter ATP-binding protein [Anaerolineaceae bacterium]
MTPPILHIEHLHLNRSSKTVLFDVNLDVYAGQIHALLGLNGSGKSTLAYTLMGCDGYSPDRGQMTFDGKDLAPLSITERARLGITLAWQEPARYEGIPVGKYVGLGAPQSDREKVIEALEAVSLPARTYGYRSVDGTLSGGERKRVELAAVYAMKPRLAILDEPDSGIDVVSLREITHLMRKLADEGSAILLITHNVEFIEACDVASLMCSGRIIYQGNPQEASQYYQNRCQPHAEMLGKPDAVSPENS